MTGVEVSVAVYVFYGLDVDALEIFGGCFDYVETLLIVGLVVNIEYR